MTQLEQENIEISTIKERAFTLNLSNADVLRFYEKAAGVGLTPQELLTTFVGDLVNGTYSNGSDERMYANEWLERCGFSHVADKTLLRYLLENESVKDFLLVKAYLEEDKISLTEMETQPHKDKYDWEEIANLKEEINCFQKKLNDISENFERWCNGASHGTDEEETAVVKAWFESYRQMLSGTQEDICKPMETIVPTSFALEP